MEEIWKDVVGYEGLYQVSNLGRVKSLERLSVSGFHVKEKILVSMNRNGYRIVNLHKDNKMKTHNIHRLVMTAFVSNYENKPAIDHINGNKSDNRLENLRWATHKENANNPNTKLKVNPFFGKKHTKESLAKMSKCHKGHKASEETRKKMSLSRMGHEVKRSTVEKILAKMSHKIVQYTLDGEFVKVWDSISEAQRQLGGHIGQCVLGKRHKAAGFRWELYKD